MKKNNTKNKKNDKLNSTMQHLVKKEQTKWFSLQNKKVKKIKYIRQKTESKA